MMAEDKQTDAGITDSIDELESLIAETRLPPRLQGEIPVLNDVVDTAEARRYAQAETTSANNDPIDKTESIPIDRLNELVDSVDQKLSNELDALVDILKDTIKDSIIDELKEQLKKESSQMQTPAANGDTSDKLSK
jgi:hypothetical protein